MLWTRGWQINPAPTSWFNQTIWSEQARLELAGGALNWYENSGLSGRPHIQRKIGLVCTLRDCNGSFNWYHKSVSKISTNTWRSNEQVEAQWCLSQPKNGFWNCWIFYPDQAFVTDQTSLNFCSLLNFGISSRFFFGGGACSSRTATNNGIPLGQSESADLILNMRIRRLRTHSGWIGFVVWVHRKPKPGKFQGAPVGGWAPCWVTRGVFARYSTPRIHPPNRMFRW